MPVESLHLLLTGDASSWVRASQNARSQSDQVAASAKRLNMSMGEFNRLSIGNVKALGATGNALGGVATKLKQVESQAQKTKSAISSASAAIGVDAGGLSTNATKAQPALLSLNQMMGDSQQFAFGAASGFRAISNNIEQFLTQMVYVTAKTGSFGGALKGIGQAFMGPVGIIVAVQLAITVFMLFGDKIKEAFDKGSTALEDFKKDIDELIESMVEFEGLSDISITVNGAAAAARQIELAKKEIEFYNNAVRDLEALAPKKTVFTALGGEAGTIEREVIVPSGLDSSIEHIKRQIIELNSWIETNQKALGEYKNLDEFLYMLDNLGQAYDRTSDGAKRAKNSLDDFNKEILLGQKYLDDYLDSLMEVDAGFQKFAVAAAIFSGHMGKRGTVPGDPTTQQHIDEFGPSMAAGLKEAEANIKAYQQGLEGAKVSTSRMTTATLAFGNAAGAALGTLITASGTLEERMKSVTAAIINAIAEMARMMIMQQVMNGSMALGPAGMLVGGVALGGAMLSGLLTGRASGGAGGSNALHGIDAAGAARRAYERQSSGPNMGWVEAIARTLVPVSNLRVNIGELYSEMDVYARNNGLKTNVGG